jgi:WD40 repeat protein
MHTALRWPVVGLAAICSSAIAAPPEPQYTLVLQAPPAASVNSVAVSPDGSLVATAAGEGGVRLYDSKSGSLLRVIGAGDRGVVFSPDGKTLTAAGFHMDKLSALWDVQSGRRLQSFAGHTEWEVDATAISPDGKLLASTGVDKQILVWEIATGKLRHRLKDQPYRIAALVFSPDSRTLATGGGDKAVKLWDMATGKLSRLLDGQRDWICPLAFSSDGKLLASGSCEWGSHRGHDWPRSPDRGEEQSEWRLWDAATGKTLRRQSEKGRILSLAISPAGDALACGVGTNVQLYDLAHDAPTRVVARHDADVTSVTFAPDGSSVFSASHDQTVQRTHLTTAKTEWHAPGYFEQVNSVALSDDGALLVTGSSDQRFARGRVKAGAAELSPGAARLWDARTGHMLRFLRSSADQFMAVAISSDGRLVAAAGSTKRGQGVASVWDGATGELIWSASEYPQEVLAVAFAPNGKSLAVGVADGACEIRDTQAGDIIRAIPNQKDGITSIVFSPDGKTLYCGEAAGSARAWEAETGRLLHTCHSPGSKAELFTIDRQMNCLGLSRDGKTLATCGSSVNNEYVDSVRLWDTHSGMLLRDFTPEKTHGRPMALSPDGSIMATGGKSVRLLDARTGKLLRELTGHLKRTQSIVFSADGKRIIAGGSYGTTNAWEVATGKHLVTLFAFAEMKNGMMADDWIAYAPDGYYDASPGGERYLGWRVGDELQTAGALRDRLHRPERIQAALALPSRGN